MGCCDSKNKKCCDCEEKEEGMSDINMDRSCTDIFGLVLFVAGWIIFIVLLSTYHAAGADPNRVVRGVDMSGNICGKDAMKNKTLAAWPYPWSLEAFQAKICVKSCDETFNGKNRAMTTLYPSTRALFYCIPNPAANISVDINVQGTILPQFQNAALVAQRTVGSIWISRHVLVVGLLLSFMLTFLFVFFLRVFAKPMVYSLLLLIIGGGFMLSQVLLQFANEQTTTIAGDGKVQRGEAAMYLGYAVLAVTGLFMFVIFFFRTQILIAIEVVREASSALMDMKLLVLYPVFPAGLCVAYLVLWCWGLLSLYSVSKQPITTPTPAIFRTYDFTWDYFAFQKLTPMDFLRWRPLRGTNNTLIPDMWTRTTGPNEEDTRKIQVQFFYLLFHMFWMMQFLFYKGYLTFAGATAEWYFSKTNPKTGDKVVGTGVGELSRFPVLGSMWRSIRYHTGTVAAASLIIAIIQTIRAIVLYIEKQTKGNPPNPIQKTVFCLINCCLKCVECCMDKINKNALIWVAVNGDNLCISMCSSFALVWRNLARVAALSYVTAIVLFMGKLTVGLLTGGVVCLYLSHNKPYSELVESPFAPALVSMVAGYCIAGMFFILFDSIIDTIFICFLIDSEVNGKGKMRASIPLQKLVGKYERLSKKEAVRQTKTREERGAHLKQGYKGEDDGKDPNVAALEIN